MRIKRENAAKELETLNSAILVSDQDNWEVVIMCNSSKY